jgi:CheY-like chemotaxis protein
MNDLNRPILLVEDNPMDVDLTRRAFARRKISFAIDVARDGEEAIRIIDQWDPDRPLPIVILLDLKLPKVDGLQVLRHLKTHALFKLVPVVILSTSSEERDILAAYREGANSYIVKPVDFDQFMHVVDQIEMYWCGLNTLPK